MPPSFLRVGLTGGIATGKSVCRERFAELGVPTIDADVLAREVVAPGTPGFDAVVRRFGPAVVAPDDGLDRAALARIVFSDPAARRDLEAIIHPAVFDRTVRWFADQQKAGKQIAIADIPLLYETNRLDRVDVIVVAACPPDIQRQRLMARNGLSAEAAQLRIDAQIPIDEKRRRADFVIDTSTTIENTRRQVDEVWEQLRVLDLS